MLNRADTSTKLNINGYGLDWSNNKAEPRIAVSSFQDKDNKIEIFDLIQDYQLAYSISTDYPVTRVLFQPNKSNNTTEWLACSTDKLSLFKVPLGNTIYDNISLEEKQDLINPRGSEKAPLTSFDWSEAQPNLLVTSSIDTTCTIWDLNTLNIKTQLIAHDSEVFDVQFASNNNGDVFGSVGADGSVRLFDLRCLDQSTIIYETQNKQLGPSLLKLRFNRMDPNYISIIGRSSLDISILDIRKPFVKLATLYAHTSPPITMDWVPNNRNLLASCGEKSSVLIFDLSTAQPSNQERTQSIDSLFKAKPSYQLETNEDVRNVKFSKSGDYFAIVSKTELKVLSF